jgi:hypothetical protein
MCFDARGHQLARLDLNVWLGGLIIVYCLTIWIKNPYGQHDAGCMDYDAPWASVHPTRHYVKHLKIYLA